MRLCESFILCWDPMELGQSQDKLVSPLSASPGHPSFITSIRLLLSSCLSMHNNPSAQPQQGRRVVHNWSHVTCHVHIYVTCHMSHFLFIFFSGKSGEAYRWRVCYQRGLPHLVLKESQTIQRRGKHEKEIKCYKCIKTN